MDRTAAARRSDVVVVGGGVMGLSTAYQLARAGVSVTVLEAAELGGGSSAKPLGGVRALFSDAANIALGARSLEAFSRFEAELGVDIGLRPVGYLFSLREAADVDAFAPGIALQNAMGVATRLVTAEAALARCPHLAGSGLVAGISSPGGHARPTDVVRGWAAAARALGASILTSTPVTAIEAVGDEALVRTARGDHRAPVVVCAAGAWSGQLGAMVGVDLPVHPVRRQIAFAPPDAERSRRTPVAAADLPFTIDFSTTAYFHGAPDGGLLLGWADPLQAPGFDRSVTTDWHAPLRAALAAFAPDLADVPLRDGWAGLYEVTPDCNALVGEADAGFRFLYAAGFSGHGFLQSPAVGECVRDLHLGRPPVVDVSAFTAARFARPAVRTELGII